MSAKTGMSNGSILEELKIALKSSRQHYGRNEMSEAKRIALEARDKALAGGLQLDAKVLEAQALICDKKWDEVILLLTDVVQNNFDMIGFAWDRLGFAYHYKKEYNKTIEYYLKALDTPGYDMSGDSLNNIGSVYADEKKYDKAIEYYQKALDTPGYETSGMSLTNMGISYYYNKDYDKAIEYYRKALNTSGYSRPGDALFNMGIAYAGKKKYYNAIASMERATQEYKKTNNVDGINTAKEIIDLWEKINIAAKKGLNKVAQEFEDVASALATSSKQGLDVASDSSLRRLIKRAGARTTAFADYARQPESVKNDVLVVLKGWSSSIPIIAKVNSEAFGGQLCRGGGYFIKAAKHGIALDPGYDYLRNLWNNGYHIKEINTVIVTHNHPDHQDDLCRIAGLDHEYRINTADSPDRSRIRYYLDQDTERACEATLVSLDADPTMIKQVDVDNSECRINKGISLNIFKTEHGDGRVVRAPFGAVIKLKLHNDTDCRIGYTSDTAYFDALSSNLKDCDIMICHFSSASADEFNNPDKMHQSHLGFNGLIKLIKNTNAKLYIVSEFWGGVGDQRYDLVEYMKKDFASKGRDIKIIAGDIGLTIDLKTLGVYCKACEKSSPFHDIRTVEPSTPYEGLRYFCKECPVSLPWKKE